MTKNNLIDIIRSSRELCLAPGLFISLTPGERSNKKLNITYQSSYSYSKKQTITFLGPEPLGANDLRVFQGLVSISNKQGILLSNESCLKNEKTLRSALLFANSATEEAVMCKTTYRKIMREIGYKGGNPKILKDSIKRLFTVSIFVKSDSQERGFHLLSFFQDDSDFIFFALNSLISNVVFLKSQFMQLDMIETRLLKTNVSRLIHYRLCGWIDPGKTGQIKLETLFCYVWSNNIITDSVHRKRKERIKKALLEILNLGWKIIQLKSDIYFKITRLNMPLKPI